MVSLHRLILLVTSDNSLPAPTSLALDLVTLSARVPRVPRTLARISIVASARVAKVSVPSVLSARVTSVRICKNTMNHGLVESCITHYLPLFTNAGGGRRRQRLSKHRWGARRERHRRFFTGNGYSCCRVRSPKFSWRRMVVICASSTGDRDNYARSLGSSTCLTAATNDREDTENQN